MCYDVQTSLIALIVNIVSSIALFIVANKYDNKQLKVIALFFLFFGFMQFFDAIFWTHKSTTKLNIYSTKLAMIWNHLEPIVLALLIYYFMKKLTLPSMIVLILYIIAVIIYSVNGWHTLKGTDVTQETCGSLYWQWNNMKGSVFVYGLFLICLLVLTQQQFTGWVKWLSILIILGTFIFSFYKYNITVSTGRFWCYLAAFSPIFFLIGMLIYLPPSLPFQPHVDPP